MVGDEATDPFVAAEAAGLLSAEGGMVDGEHQAATPTGNRRAGQASEEAGSRPLQHDAGDPIRQVDAGAVRVLADVMKEGGDEQVGIGGARRLQAAGDADLVRLVMFRETTEGGELFGGQQGCKQRPVGR